MWRASQASAAPCRRPGGNFGKGPVVQTLAPGADDPLEDGPRPSNRMAYLTLLLAAALTAGGWVTQLLNLPAG